MLGQPLRPEGGSQILVGESDKKNKTIVVSILKFNQKADKNVKVRIHAGWSF